MQRRTSRFQLLTLLVALVQTMPAAAEVLEADPFKSVKVSHAVLRQLVSEGHDRSPTFRQLVSDLDASGWLVFVQPGPCPEKAAIACLLHVVARFEAKPYLRVLVDHKRRHRNNVIATLAHELQHALEVVQAPDVEDGAAMRALFERIGVVRARSATGIAYETETARRIGEVVVRELQAENARGNRAPKNPDS